MRHQKLNRRFGRNISQRKELIRSLVRALFNFHRIETTVEKAKEARKLAEKLITHAKKGALSDIRAINKVLQDKPLTKKVVAKISPLFKERSSGYTRIMRSGFRRGDGASLAILELTDMPAIEKKPKKVKPARAAVSTAKEEKAAVKAPEAKKRVAVKEVTAPKIKEEPKKKEEKPEKVKPAEEKKPKEERPAPEKKGFLGRFRGFFKKKD